MSLPRRSRQNGSLDDLREELSLPTLHLKDISDDLRMLGFQVGPRSTSKPVAAEEPPHVTLPKPLPVADYRSNNLESETEIQDAIAHHKKISSLCALNLDPENEEEPQLRGPIPASKKWSNWSWSSVPPPPNRRPTVKPTCQDSKAPLPDNGCYMSREVDFDRIPLRTKDRLPLQASHLPTRALDSKTQGVNPEDYGIYMSHEVDFDRIRPRSHDNSKDRPAVRHLNTKIPPPPPLPQVTPPKPLPDCNSNDLGPDTEIQDAKSQSREEYGSDDSSFDDLHFDHLPPGTLDNSKDRLPLQVDPLPTRALDSKTQGVNLEDYGIYMSHEVDFDRIRPRTLDNSKDRPAVRHLNSKIPPPPPLPQVTPPKPLPVPYYRSDDLGLDTDIQDAKAYHKKISSLCALNLDSEEPQLRGIPASNKWSKWSYSYVPQQDQSREEYGSDSSFDDLRFDHLPPRTLDNSKDRLPLRALDSKTQHENHEDYDSDDSSFDDFEDCADSLDSSKDLPLQVNAPLPPPLPQVTPPRPIPQSPYSFTLDQEIRLEYEFLKAGRRMPYKTVARAIQADLLEVNRWFTKRVERRSKMLVAYKPLPPKRTPKVIPDAFGLRLLDLNFEQLFELEEYYSRGIYFVPNEVKEVADRIQAELSEVHEWLRRREWLEEKRTGRNADIYWLPKEDPKEVKKRATVVQKAPVEETPAKETCVEDNKAQDLEILELKKQLEQERKEHEETKSQLSDAKKDGLELKNQLEQEKKEHEETKSHLTHAEHTITSQATDIRELNFWVATLRQKPSTVTSDDSGVTNRVTNLENKMDQMNKDMEALKTPTPSLRDLIAAEIKRYATEPDMVEEVKNEKKKKMEAELEKVEKENFYRIQFSKSVDTVAEKDEEVEELKKNLHTVQNINVELHDSIKEKNLLVETLTEHVKKSEAKICDLEAELEKGKLEVRRFCRYPPEQDIILGHLRFAKYY